jgi:transcriptional regulator GlxA family with amidase domain
MSVSLCHHLKQRRLLCAERLLHTTFLSVKQIASAAGFHDTHHFVREFRRVFGRPPGEYRRTAVFGNK